MAEERAEPRRCHWCGGWLGVSGKRRKGYRVLAVRSRYTEIGTMSMEEETAEGFDFHVDCFRAMMSRCLLDKRAAAGVQS